MTTPAPPTALPAKGEKDDVNLAPPANKKALPADKNVTALPAAAITITTTPEVFTVNYQWFDCQKLDDAIQMY